MSKGVPSFQNNLFKSYSIIDDVENDSSNSTGEKSLKNRKEEKGDFKYPEKIPENSNIIFQNELKLSSIIKGDNLNINIEIENVKEKNDDNEMENNNNYNLIPEFINLRENEENSLSEKLNKSDCENLQKISINKITYNNFFDYTENNQTNNHIIISVNDYVNFNSKIYKTNFLTYRFKKD